MTVSTKYILAFVAVVVVAIGLMNMAIAICPTLRAPDAPQARSESDEI